MHNKLHLQLQVEVEPRTSLFNKFREAETRLSLSNNIINVSVYGASINNIELSDNSYSAIQALSEERAIEDIEVRRGKIRERILRRISRLSSRLNKYL